jgi:hypothetical protein
MRPFATVLVIVALVASACSDDGRLPSSRDDVTVVVGQDLGLGPVDRVVPGFSVGVWKATVEGGVATILERHLVGDEAGAGHRIVIDFNRQTPTVVEVAETRDDAERGASSEPFGPGTLFLQDTDPSGVISGEYSADSGGGFRFWVDTADATYVDGPIPGETFQLRPGGVADSFSFATQLVGIVEDSRCPPDARCVWEGRVVVSVRYISDAGWEEFELRGFVSPQGPVFGDAPTYPATPVAPSTLELALVGLAGDVATLMWASTE